MHKIDTPTLGIKARSVIDSYINLPFNVGVSCPYFNSRRRKNRGGLRVTKGKGTPAEIVEEATIMAKFSRTDLTHLSTDLIKEFLVENDLGIDCSGFAYHVLNAFTQEKTGKSITSFVTSNRTGIVGSFLARLRPAENLGVNSFRNDRNSTAIAASDALPGDFITFIGTGKDKTYNHILVITSVVKTGSVVNISYAHSYMWPSDGLYKHGVREGEIILQNNDLQGGTWREQGVTGTDNYTFESARNAAEVSVRRLNCAIY